jgi:outer membrane immunogenic protein
MKKVLGGIVLSALLAGPVAAADLRMPVKAPPPVIVTVFDWTGCYIGGHVGYAWGKKTVTPAIPVVGFNYNHDIDGWVAGGQVGCNLWQRDRWVLGIEGQVSWADLEGQVLNLGFTAANNGFRTDANVIGSIAGRLAYAFGATGQTLVFVKGGAAFINERFYANAPAPAVANWAFSSGDDLRWGWMVGAGIEQALTRNWSLKGEYNYSNFGNENYRLCNVANLCFDYNIKQHVHLVKFGVNYRFGGPVVARF